MKKHNNILKSIISLLLLLACMASFCACKGPITDDEARDIAKELIEKEITLTSYVYGDAFALSNPAEYDQHKNDTSFYYAKVSEKSPYTTKKQLEDAIDEIYTKKVAQEIKEFAFIGAPGADGVTIIARFYQSPEEDRLKIDVTTYGIYDLTAVVLLDTLTVKRSTRSMMEVTVSYRAGSSETLREMKIMIRKENDTWKLDTRTWSAGIE